MSGKVNYLGFQGIEPHSIIVWIKDNKQCGKTVCYSQDEVEQALEWHAGKYDSHIFC